MNKGNFLHRIINHLRAIRQSPHQPAVVHPSNDMMGKILRMVDNTAEVEIACDEVFDLLDRFVELEARGEDVSKLLPMVKLHLENCQDCHEEYEALVRVIEATSA